MASCLSGISNTIYRKHSSPYLLSADVRSGALAGDFAKISKELIVSGLSPTCLSSLDLQAIMLGHRGPMLYGRDEMGLREEQKATTPAIRFLQPVA